MPIKHRLLGVLGGALCCLGLLCAALVWQTLQHAQQRQARELLHTLAHSWRQLEAEQMAQLEHALGQLAVDQAQATPKALGQHMRALAGRHAGLRIDLFDAHARMLLTTADGIQPEPLLDPAALLDAVQGRAVARGLHQLPSRQYVWRAFGHVGPHLLVLVQDAATALPILSERLPGHFFLLNMRGTPVAAPPADDVWLPGVQVAARKEQVLHLQAGDPALAGQTALRLVSQPLTRTDGTVIGTLLWHQNASTSAQADRRFTLEAAAAVCMLLALLTTGLVFLVRHTLSPLARSMTVLQSLAQGHTDAALQGGEEDADDESGAVARSVARLRSELLHLETLRQERVRTRRQQERLIRDQLRSLASSLEPASRDEILAALGTQATTQSEGDSGLAELAGILGRMSGLVSTQQSRLLQLLREVQASVQTQAVLASLQQELEIARRMQRSILPRQTLGQREIDIASAMIPAKEVGGDFYDYFHIDSDHLAIVIADVSGKGVPAAFFMAIARTLLKSNGLFLRSPGATIAALNDQLCAENDQMMFVTVFYAVLQLSSGQLTYVNAGHNPPILLRAGHAQYFPKGKNMALAVSEGQPYNEGRLQLSAGDSLLLYTDGVTDAANAHHAMYGDDRLLQTVLAVMRHPDTRPPAQRLTEQIVQDVRGFEAGAPQADDITLVALTYRGTAP